MKNRLSKSTLYKLVAHKKYNRVFSYLRSKQKLSDFDIAIFCLLYALLGDNYEYKKRYESLITKKISSEVETIFLEAQLLKTLSLKHSEAIIVEKTNQILKRDRKSIFALSTSGQTQFIRKDISGALETFDKLIAKYPSVDWLKRFVAYHLIVAKHYKDSKQYSSHIENPTQRIAYVWAANFIPLRLYLYLILAVVMILVSKDFALGIVAFICILITPCYIYFVWVKDKYMFGLLGNTLFFSGLVYFITKYINL